MCRAINTMTSSMAKVAKGLEQVQTELRQQKSHVDVVVTQVEKIAANTAVRMQKFEDAMKTKNEDIDARLAKLAASSLCSWCCLSMSCWTYTAWCCTSPDQDLDRRLQ
jgi:t-SNARE complex subunit (syntaxin)